MRYGHRINILPCIMIFCAWGAEACALRPGQNQGLLSMQGSIIATPCAIATDDRNQTISLGITTLGEIIHNGQGPQRTFSLHLINCDLHSASNPKMAWNRFNTTFDGPSENGIFSIYGAEGVGLQIMDAAGNIAFPGRPLPDGSLIAGTQRLDYTLRLIGNHQRLKAGEYHTILRFKVDYF